MPQYQGPVRPGSDEETFRETGEDKPAPFQGPVRPGSDEETFRETGTTKPKVTSGGLVGGGRDKIEEEKVVDKTVTEKRNEAQQNYLDKLRKQTQENISRRETLKDFRSTPEYQKYKERLVKENKVISDVDIYNEYVSDVSKQQLAEREKLGKGYSTKEGYVYVKPAEVIETKQKSLISNYKVQKPTGVETRGTGFYNPKTKKYEVAPSKLVLDSGDISFIDFLSAPIPGAKKLARFIAPPPKTYVTEAGASTRLVEPTKENLAKIKSFGEKPYFVEVKPTFVQYAVAGLIPQTVGSGLLFAATAGVGAVGLKYLPKTTSTIFTGFGAYNVPKYVSAKTYEEKSITAAGTLGLLAYRTPYNAIKDIYITRGMTELPASKVVAPEVLSYYEGGKGTLFPYDKPSTFQQWFTKRNIQTYGLPNVPKELQNKPFGYSATSSGSVIEQKGIGEAGQFYSGKGVSIAFLRLSKETKGMVGQDYGFGDKPYIYALYGKDTKVVPSAYEVKVPNPYESGGKPIKKYIFPNTDKEAGTFYIPTNKPEVQAVVYGNIAPVRKSYYIKLGGRRVPIGEYISAEDGIILESNIKAGSIEKPSSSVLPYKSSIPKSSIPISSSSYISSSSKIESSLYPISSSASKSNVSNISNIDSSKLINPAKNIAGSSISKISSSSYVSNKISNQSPIISRIKSLINESKIINNKSRTYLTTTKNIGGNDRGNKVSRLEAYKVYILKKGKKEYLKGLYSLGEAKEKGSGVVLSSLAATFGIEKTNEFVAGGKEDYYLSENRFRDYRIRKQGRQKLQNIWIQKAGTTREGTTIKGARLSSAGERKEIQMFKRQKSGRSKWFS